MNKLKLAPQLRFIVNTEVELKIDVNDPDGAKQAQAIPEANPKRHWISLKSLNSLEI